MDQEPNQRKSSAGSLKPDAGSGSPSDGLMQAAPCCHLLDTCVNSMSHPWALPLAASDWCLLLSQAPLPSTQHTSALLLLQGRAVKKP